MVTEVDWIGVLKLIYSHSNITLGAEVAKHFPVFTQRIWSWIKTSGVGPLRL